MKITRLIGIFRFDEWDKTLIPLFLSCILSKVVFDWGLLLFLLNIIIIFMFGFLLNSYADRKDDQKIKKVRIYYFKKHTIISTLSVLAITSLLLGWVSDGFVYYFIFLVSVYIYSAWPFRLKKRGFLGLLFLVMIMMPYPYFIYSMIFNVEPLIAWFFLVYLFLYSFNDELLHQIYDRQNDIKTRTRTFAARFGQKNSISLLQITTALLVLSTLSTFIFFDPTKAASIALLLNLVNVDLYKNIYQDISEVREWR
jgi:4-hydroxybenzoate polyprenyltransferase